MIATLLAMFALGPPGFGNFIDAPSTEVMIVGTTHLHTDDIIDITTDERQAELSEIIEELVAFQPTFIGLECTGEEAESRLNAQYLAWRQGEHELTANERQQIGFRLAARNNLDQVHCVDADFPPAPNFDAYDDWDELFDAARESGEWSRIEEWIPVIESYAAAARDYKASATLPEIYDWLNTTDTEYSQARMLLVEIGIGVGSDWAGADWLGRFQGRNIRIFSLVRKCVQPGDRVLLLFGNAHKRPLDSLFERSPEFTVVDVPEFVNED